MPLELLLRSNLAHQEISRMNVFSLLIGTVQVTPEVMRLLGGLTQRQVTRDDSEWAAAIAALTVSERVRKNHRDDSTKKQKGL